MKLKYFAEDKNLLKQYSDQEKIQLVCDICNTDFFLSKETVRTRAKNSRSGKYHTFCSLECNLKSRDTKQKIFCTYCNIEFFRSPKEMKKSKDGKQYCSHGCRAKYMNYKVLSKDRTCKGCGETYKQPPLSGRTSKYCFKCVEKNGYLTRSDKIDNMTIAEFITKNNLGNSKTKKYHSAIRRKCRDWNSSLIKECQYCGYNKVVEYAHIKPVKDFPETATLGEVNSSDNILVLCPNHHAEFDRNLLTLEEIRTKLEESNGV